METDPDPELEAHEPSTSSPRPDANRPSPGRRRGTLALCGGAASILLGAWLTVRGIESLSAPLLSVWQIFWSGWTGEAPEPHSVVQVFVFTTLWFAGAVAASLFGWAMVLRGIDLLWKPQPGPR